MTKTHMLLAVALMFRWQLAPSYAVPILITMRPNQPVEDDSATPGTIQST
jgi:hypothetical protein